jgi:hypothetical protein
MKALQLLWDEQLKYAMFADSVAWKKNTLYPSLFENPYLFPFSKNPAKLYLMRKMCPKNRYRVPNKRIPAE